MASDRPTSSAPYREPADIAADIPPSPKRVRRLRFWLPLKMLVILAAPIGVGTAHDLCTPAHEGIAWASAVVSFMLGIASLWALLEDVS